MLNYRVKLCMWYSELSVKQSKMNYPRRSEVEHSLEKAQSELEGLKEQRNQHMQLTESIVRQRDMYRVLLAQATGVSFPQQGIIHYFILRINIFI